MDKITADALCGRDIEKQITFEMPDWGTIVGELRQIYVNGGEVILHILQDEKELGDYPHWSNGMAEERPFFVEYMIGHKTAVTLERIGV